MNCTKCKSKIEKGQLYHRTKKGSHHADCTQASRVSRSLSAVPSDGEIWSVIRTLMDHGATIQLDYTNKGYEEYSARMDAAARERTDWLKKKLFERGIAG